MTWNPDQYHRFRSERMAPFEDLVHWLKVRSGLSAIDLGCGTGELTLRLRELLPGSTVLGIDSSATMLPAAEGFQLGRIEDLTGQYDLIFSHAALQWVDDQQALFASLWEHLRPGGQLLVQIPYNFDHISHVAAAAIARQLGQPVRSLQVLPPEAYAGLLYDLGAEDFQVILKVYPHILENAEAIVEWSKGTLLTAYTVTDEFVEQYTAEVRRHCPGSPVFYGFKRMLMTATRPTGN